MNDPKIVASVKDARRRAPDKDRETGAWAVLGWIGLVFLVVGFADFALAWIPLDFGNPEWEFGTVTASFNGLPILLLGLGLLSVGANESGRRWWALLQLVSSGALFVWVLVGLALWATNVSLALSAVPTEMQGGIREAVLKTALQSVVYSAALAYLARQGWTVVRRASTGPEQEH